MKPKMINFYKYKDSIPIEIKEVLNGMAYEFDEHCAEYKAMTEAVEYIAHLETLVDLLTPLAQCGMKSLNDPLIKWMNQYFKNNHKELSQEFVKIVEEHFWELLA